MFSGAAQFALDQNVFWCKCSEQKWDLGPVRLRVEAKLINWPFSPLRLASWLRTANIGSLTADPHPNHVVNFNQAKVIMAFARARPTSKGRKGWSPKQWFSNGIMVLNSKKRALFFLRWRAGDEHERLWRIQDHNHGKIQHRHRCESNTRSGVWGCLCADIYVWISYGKCDLVRRILLPVSNCKLVSSSPLTSKHSVVLHFLVSRFE